MVRVSAKIAPASMALAAVYGIGLLAKSAQFSQAHQSPAHLLPLIPPDQILLSGFTALLSRVPAWALGGLLVYVLFRLGGRQTRARRFAKTLLSPLLARLGRLAANRRVVRVSVMCLVPVLLLAVLTSSVSTLESIAFTAILCRWWRPATVPWPNWGMRAALLLFCMALLPGYLRPPPLPQVKLLTRAGRVVKGDLLITTSTALYVGTGDQAVKIVSPMTYAIVSTHTSEPDRDIGLFESLIGQELPDLLGE